MINPDKGELFQTFMHGTSPDLSARENIALIAFLEEESVKIAKRNHFKGVFTTNTNPLTQQFSKSVYGYETVNEVQVNKYEAFGNAPDFQKVIVAYKNIEHQHFAL